VLFSREEDSSRNWKKPEQRILSERRRKLAAAKVLDSWALLPYLERGRGYEKIIGLFNKRAKEIKSLSKPLFYLQNRKP